MSSQRLTFVNPGETISPDPNNLQRWATQPVLGCYYYSSTLAAVTNVGLATPSQCLFGGATGAGGTGYFHDPNNMIDLTTSYITFREEGIWHIQAKVLSERNPAAATTDALELTASGTAATNGYSILNREYNNYGAAFTHMFYDAEVPIFDVGWGTGPKTIPTWKMLHGWSAAGGKNIYFQYFMARLISKTLPAKY